MVQCPMTGEDEELANDMMMSTMLGANAGKRKMSKGMAGGMEGYDCHVCRGEIDQPSYGEFLLSHYLLFYQYAIHRVIHQHNTM